MLNLYRHDTTCMIKFYDEIMHSRTCRRTAPIVIPTFSPARICLCRVTLFYFIIIHKNLQAFFCKKYRNGRKNLIKHGLGEVKQGVFGVAAKKSGFNSKKIAKRLDFFPEMWYTNFTSLHGAIFLRGFRKSCSAFCSCQKKYLCEKRQASFWKEGGKRSWTPASVRPSTFA